VIYLALENRDWTLMTRPTIVIPTLEQLSGGEKTQCFNLPSDGEMDTPIPIEDPFGLRKAVVPVYLQNQKGELEGSGTAFHADSWGTLISATHVFERLQMQEISRTPQVKAVVILGIGVLFGTRKLPPEAIVPIASVSYEGDLHPIKWST
jgi:serine protease Do